MTIPESVLEEIRARAKESWPDDKDMREYSVKEEIDGYRKYSRCFEFLTNKKGGPTAAFPVHLQSFAEYSSIRTGTRTS